MALQNRTKISQTISYFLGQFGKAVGMFVVLVLQSATVDAQVYLQEDESGRRIYSNTKSDESQPQTQLPPLYRENLEDKIRAIQSSSPKSCDSHGGIDCSAGPDKADQSAICLDGFKDSDIPFIGHCSFAKLQAKISVEFVSEPIIRPFEEVFKAERRLDLRPPVALLVSIRNVSGVKAMSVETEFKIPGITRKIKADGPETIQAYGNEDYRLPLAGLVTKKELFRLAKVKLKVRCENCEGFKKSK